MLACSLWSSGSALVESNNNVLDYQHQLQRVPSNPLSMLPTEARTLVKALLSYEPAQRPTPADALQSSYFGDMTFLALQYLQSLMVCKHILHAFLCVDSQGFARRQNMRKR